jgi:hypothetical protein
MLFHPPGAIRIATPAEIAAATPTRDATVGAPRSFAGGTAR